MSAVGISLKDIDQALRDLEYYFRVQSTYQKELEQLNLLLVSSDIQSDRLSELQESILRMNDKCKSLLRLLIEFPPRHIRHFQKLREFWKDGNYDQSVFIMTKFPDENGDKTKNAELERVLNAITTAIEACDFTPRVARFPNNYHLGLWDNVELHMLGSSRGVAVVQDKYVDELNPNVMMEWGWMRGMGKGVFFLLEKDFRNKNFRADLGDLLSEEFAWNAPEKDVEKGIARFLRGPGRSPGKPRRPAVKRPPAPSKPPVRQKRPKPKP